MSLSTFLTLLLVAGAICLYLVARALLAVGKRMAREAQNQLARRVVDALLAVVLYSWWKGKQAPARPRPPVLQGDDLFRSCSLSRWSGDPARCRMCDAPIPPRRSGALCSSRCDRLYRENHVFGGPGGAREARLRTDNDTCVRPGCGVTHHYDRSLEVHHRDEPALGRHNEVSCVHHQHNLETLCGRHHDGETYGPRRPHPPRRRRSRVR